MSTATALPRIDLHPRTVHVERAADGTLTGSTDFRGPCIMEQAIRGTAVADWGSRPRLDCLAIYLALAYCAARPEGFHGEPRWWADLRVDLATGHVEHMDSGVVTETG